MSQIDIDVTERLEVLEFATASQLVNQTLKKSKFINGHINIIKGIPSGFFEFDQITKGFQNAEVSTFAIKKGMGKTAFLLSLINNIGIKNKFSLGLFSPERTSDKIINRIIESETGTSIENLNTNNFSEFKKYQIGLTINQISNSNIFIDDTPNLSLKEIYKRATLLKNDRNINIIVIDCINLFVQSNSEHKENNVQFDEIMGFFKKLSKELDIPVVLFYQIDKPYDEIFHLKIPVIKDLPDIIAEHSDNIYIIHRTDLPYLKEDTISQKDYCEIHIPKQANSDKMQMVKLKFLPSIDKFVDFI